MTLKTLFGQYRSLPDIDECNSEWRHSNPVARNGTAGVPRQASVHDGGKGG